MKKILTDENGTILCAGMKEADSFWSRFAGLMGRRTMERDEGLLLKHVSAIHTCFMRFPIDVIYLDTEMTVVDKETVQPWRMGRMVKRAAHVLEMRADEGRRFLNGQQLKIQDIATDGKER